MTAALDREQGFRQGRGVYRPPISEVDVVGQSDGTVLGAPRRWLRLEGAILPVGALLAFSTTRQAWWLVPLTVLAPDFLAVGYMSGNRTGARLYNLAHSTPMPAVMVGLGLWRGMPIVLALGLVWLAHLGVDRVLGYGLKYNDDFRHTHLGWSGGGDGRRTAKHDRGVSSLEPTLTVRRLPGCWPMREPTWA